jgi:hypothetical protein
VSVCNSADSSAASKSVILFEQILDSSIVAGITGICVYVYAGQDASWKAAALSFLLRFIMKMKKYRKIGSWLSPMKSLVKTNKTYLLGNPQLR